MVAKIVKFTRGKKTDGNDEKGEFRKIAKHTGGHWFYANMLKGAHTGEPKESELKILRELKNEIKKSALHEKEKTRLEELLSAVDETDRWDVIETTLIVKNYTARNMPQEQANYHIESLKAWREGKIEEFAKGEMTNLKGKDLKTEEKHALTQMLMVGANRGGLGAALAVKNLIIYQFTEEDADKKIDRVGDITETLKYV